MRWLGYGAIGVAGTLGVFFLYVGASPWLVWYMLPVSEATTVAVFSSHVPTILLGQQAHSFVSVWGRWRYVMQHSSRAAWQKTVQTLVTSRVPWQPAALVSSPAWFDAPTVIAATTDGRQIHLLAHPAKALDVRLGRLDAPDTPDMAMMVPGAILPVLSQHLKESWNTLLYQRLGFIATTPDILGTLASFEHVVISIEGSESSVGIVTEAVDERERWRKSAIGWVVDEDRFRRPRDQVFRLPDGSRGRERLAGLPREVFLNEYQGTCLGRLPEVPVLSVCEGENQVVLANYAWSPSAATVRGAATWEVALRDDFVQYLPGIEGIRAHGTESAAAAVITVAP